MRRRQACDDDPGACRRTAFSIPMRGNEPVDLLALDGTGEVFSIPMRGNEELTLRIAPLYACPSFSIPMRGNEYEHEAVRRSGSAVADVFDPHEG